MHRPRRLPVRRAPIPNTWTAIVILGALTTFSLTFGSGMAAPRRSQEAAAITNPTVGQPTAGRQPWLKYEPALAGKVLHWVETSYSTVPNSPDPANGRAVTADIWELIGQDGTPLLFHGQYTIAGVFHQEVVETPARLDITYGRDYDHIALGKALPCTVSARPSAGDGMRGLLPPFADAAVLARISVNSGQGIPSHSLPLTSPLARSRLLATYSAVGSVRWWVQRQPGLQPYPSYTARQELGPDGRVLVAQAQWTDADGHVVSQSWTAYGALEVYSPETTPTSVFGMHHSAGGC